MIGAHSCFDTAVFELVDLPALESVVIGETTTSLCFSAVQSVAFHALPSIKEVSIGSGCFSFAEQLSVSRVAWKGG